MCEQEQEQGGGGGGGGGGAQQRLAHTDTHLRQARQQRDWFRQNAAPVEGRRRRKPRRLPGAKLVSCFGTSVWTDVHGNVLKAE